MIDKTVMTPFGEKSLREELDHLIRIVRPQIVNAIATAREHGDLKENAEYHAAREEQGLNEARIRELEEALSTSQVIEYKDLAVTDRIIFGSTVTIVDLETDKKNTYQIVGESEANIEENTISLTTPIARSLLKKEVGDVVEVSTPGGVKEVEILEIKLI